VHRPPMNWSATAEGLGNTALDLGKWSAASKGQYMAHVYTNGTFFVASIIIYYNQDRRTES
jgi:hypothetical protein